MPKQAHNKNPKLFFLKTALSDIMQVGSLTPSSRYLVRKMVSFIDQKQARIIVEYGTGTGVLSRAILDRCPVQARLIGLELNPRFHQFLSKRITDSRFSLFNENALNVGKCLKQCNIAAADYMLSGLPFALFPRQKQRDIIKETCRHLRPGGKFIIFQYSRAIKKLLCEMFLRVDVHFVPLNIPPAYVFVCSNEP